MHQLDPSIKTVWSLAMMARTLFFSVVVLVAEFIFLSDFKNWPATGIIPASVFTLGIILSFTYPLLKYKYWKFDVRPEELFLERGVFTRIKTTAPYIRIQHLDVEQSIFDRMLGLAKLVIYTAGTRGADVVIPGLPSEYAEALRDQLKSYTGEDAV